MGSLSWYPEKKALFNSLIDEKASKDTAIIVVIPAFDEPGITSTLDSLKQCSPPRCNVEVLIVVNAPHSTTAVQFAGYKKTIKNIQTWKSNNSSPFFQLFVIDKGIQQNREWGVGMARKTGMDEALRRFDEIDNPNGVIVCLDADCKVSEGYFLSVYNDLFIQESRNAAIIYFEHPLDEADDPKSRDAISKYELYLRYYYQAIKYSGYPEVYHTVGSTIAIRASLYAKVGGMNRRQGGEDFYFVQKLIPSANLYYNISETVYPSPRISNRVPFGTGTAVKGILESDDQSYYTYNPSAFYELGQLFSIVDNLFRVSEEIAEISRIELPESIRSFLYDNGWSARIAELNANTASLETFRKRFFAWFNMFKIVKFLNMAHAKGYFDKIEITKAASELLEKIGGISIGDDAESVLKVYRSLER